MVSLKELVLKDDTPIYLQIVRYIKSGIVAKIIVNGDEMPSRRTVSALLGVNPNTIQKAYKMLEDESLIFSQTGAKSHITLEEGQVDEMKAQLVSSDIKQMISAMEEMGIKKQEALDLLEQLWEES